MSHVFLGFFLARFGLAEPCYDTVWLFQFQVFAFTIHLFACTPQHFARNQLQKTPFQTEGTEESPSLDRFARIPRRAFFVPKISRSALSYH